LALLRQHPILSLEVTSGVGNELAVARMIDGFHADDDLHQPGIMLADVLDQLGLGIGWPGNENRAGVCDRLRDSLKEGVVLRGVPAPDGVCLMVDVLGRTIRMQDEPFHIGRTEMEHAGFMVIDPDDRMKVMAIHGTVLSPAEYRTASIDASKKGISARLPRGGQGTGKGRARGGASTCRRSYECSRAGHVSPRGRAPGVSTMGGGGRGEAGAVAPALFRGSVSPAANGLLSFPSTR